MTTPTPGQKTIPIKDWNRFLRVADWYERTVEHKTPGALRPTYGHTTIVKTPEGGIDARDGTDLSSATCIRCVAAETVTPGEKTLHETEEELLVYNSSEADIPGDIYIQTVLTLDGTRFAVDGGGVTESHWGKLDDILFYSDTTGVTCSIWAGNPLVDTTDDIANVLPAPYMTSGSIRAGEWVRIIKLNGRWRVEYMGVEQTVVTQQRHYQLNLEIKTRKAVFWALNDESAWTEVVPGTESCPDP